MGYQVGNHCYATKQEAENVYFSLVAPVISTSSTTTTTSATNNPRPPPTTAIRPAPTTTTSKATLIQPEYVNGKWMLQGQAINANLPKCEPADSFKNGAEMGWLIFGVIASCYVFVILKRLLR